MSKAETTNTLSDAEIQGRALVQKILSLPPENNYTNTGVLEIRDGAGKRVQISVQFKTIIGGASWKSVYSTEITNTSAADPAFNRNYYSKLTVIHSGDRSSIYEIPNVNSPPAETNSLVRLTGAQLTAPFARSDFWLCDLGLEFFQWPQQKILKKEFHHNCACEVLESTNPNPTADGYSRVVSWIDEDSLGIVEAFAYDINGKKLKNFYPKSLEKVNGQYQVTTMVMDNLQTGSRSKFDFDLEK
jgi:hypothetical protein